MTTKDMKKESNLTRLAKSPVRFLIIARDAYIRSLTSCSAGFIRGGVISGGFGLPAGNFQICDPPNTTLPRSFTLSCSSGTGGGEITEETKAMRRPLGLRRNYTCIVMGRIDEEKGCDEFEEEDEDLLFDYSQTRKIGGVMFTTHQQ